MIVPNFGIDYHASSILAMRYSRNSKAYKHLASYLTAAREAKGLSLTDLSGQLGVYKSVIGKIETNDRKIDIFEFIALCQALDIDPAELVRDLELFLNTQKP